MQCIKHVVCGISGGVDSAVTAALLKGKGFQVSGLFMKNWDQQNEQGRCTGELDRDDAHYVCQKLQIPLHEVNFVKEYWNNVFSNMVEGYEKGITPNPDVLCNKHVKFGPFLEYATSVLGADAIATGHYARNSAGQFLQHLNPKLGTKLLQSCDPSKDQTLFLSQIPQEALQKTMFPIGDLLKSKVKAIALQIGLKRIVEKKESTGICFIGSRHFQSFIDQYLEPKEGEFVDIESGAVVGQHKGVHKWTIGQRTNIGGQSAAYFVASRCHTTQRILVAKGTLHPALHFQNMETDTPHWIHRPLPGLNIGPVSCGFRFQHTHPIEDSIVTELPCGGLGVRLEQPSRAITCGQYAVFYRDIECLGSAQILSTKSLYHEDIGCDLNEKLSAKS